MPPPTITVRFAPWWIACGIALHAVLAVVVGTVAYLDGVPIWFMGPVVFGVGGTINAVVAASGVYPYLRLTPQRISYRSAFSRHRMHIDLHPGDIVVATKDGLYRRPGGRGEWDRVGARPGLANAKDWQTLQHWTGSLEPRPEPSPSAQLEPAQPEPPTSAVITDRRQRQKRERKIY
jgi:hypothetical protein